MALPNHRPSLLLPRTPGLGEVDTALSVRNWSKFQHYKDRCPPWIKLHRELLNDRKFMALSAGDRGNLMLIWVLAAEYDGNIPDDPSEVAWRLRMPSIDLEPLIAAGFLLVDGAVDARPDWVSRYIPDKVRAAALAKTDGKCAACSSEEFIEIDHIIPVSRGGTGDLDNLQALCRSCNRKKRAKTELHVDPCVALATQINEPLRRSLPETEGETEGEEKRIPSPSAPLLFPAPLPPEQTVMAYWSERSETKLRAPGSIDATLRRIRQRLKDGFTAEDLCACVDFALIDPFYVEKGYAKNPHVLWKNAPRVEDLLRRSKAPPAPIRGAPVTSNNTAVLDEWEREVREGKR